MHDLIKHDALMWLVVDVVFFLTVLIGAFRSLLRDYIFAEKLHFDPCRSTHKTTQHQTSRYCQKSCLQYPSTGRTNRA